LSQLRQEQNELVERGVDVKVITFDDPQLANPYAESLLGEWPLLLDSDRSLYRRYGFERGSWSAIYGVSSVVRYLGLILSGHRPGRPGKDWRQLGGDVLVDPEGIVRIHHVCKTPHDRPTIEDLLLAIKR
jgi:hypothetical protein